MLLLRSCQARVDQFPPQPICGQHGCDPRQDRWQAHGERCDSQQPECGRQNPHVQSLPPEVGREEDRAAAGQHIERVQPVSSFVAKQAGRHVPDVPQAEKARNQRNGCQVHPRIGQP